MGLAAYLGTVISIVVMAIGAMYMIVRLLGKQIDNLATSTNNRFDDLNKHLDQRFDAIESRLTRLESQYDGIAGAVADLGQRVARLEANQ